MTANAPSTRTKQRSLRLLAWTRGVTNGGYVRITEGKKVDVYEVTEISSDYGRGFTCQKVHAEPGQPATYEPAYAVNIHGDESSCECPGFLRWSHRTPCRHVAALTALIASEQI